MRWLIPLGLATLILLASVQCWPAYPRWSTRLREQAFLALAALGAVLMAAICWPLAVVFGLTLWRDRETASDAVRTWGTACAVWALTVATPPRWRWLLPAAYVTAALGQCLLLTYQASRWVGRGHNYHDLRNALHGSVGTRFFCGLWCAQALPLAVPLAMGPLVLGLMATSSATALLAATVGMAVAYPAQVLPITGGFVLVALAVMTWRKGWPTMAWTSAFNDGTRERLILWRLMLARWTRVSWRARLIGSGHDAFTTQSRWWARVDGPLNRVHLHGTNDGLQSLLEIGLVGVAALVWLVASTLWFHGAWGDPLTGAVLAILVGSLFQFPLHAAHMAIPSLILVALLAAR